MTDELAIQVMRPQEALSFEAFSHWIENQASQFRQDIKENGAILFRGFPIETPEQYKEIHQKLNAQVRPYIGGAKARIDFEQNETVIYIPTSSPKYLQNRLHSEMAYLPELPSTITLFCEKPADVGGESFLGCNQTIYEKLDSKLKEKWEKKGLKFTRVFPSQKIIHKWIEKIDFLYNIPTWQGNFNVSEKSQVEACCDRLGLTWSWVKNEVLETTVVIPPSRTIDGKKYWLNNAHFFKINPKVYGRSLSTIMLLMKQFSQPLSFVTFADGDEIPMSEINHVLAVLDENKLVIEHQKGDLFYVDNLRMAHGRNVFKGERRVFFAQHR